MGIIGNEQTSYRKLDAISTQGGRGHLAVYDLRSLKQTSELSFGNRISSQLFSGDGKKLFVTNDQTAFILDATAVDTAGQPGR